MYNSFVYFILFRNEHCFDICFSWSFYFRALVFQLTHLLIESLFYSSNVFFYFRFRVSMTLLQGWRKGFFSAMAFKFLPFLPCGSISSSYIDEEFYCGFLYSSICCFLLTFLLLVYFGFILGNMVNF